MLDVAHCQWKAELALWENWDRWLKREGFAILNRSLWVGSLQIWSYSTGRRMEVNSEKDPLGRAHAQSEAGAEWAWGKERKGVVARVIHNRSTARSSWKCWDWCWKNRAAFGEFEERSHVIWLSISERYPCAVSKVWEDSCSRRLQQQSKQEMTVIQQG